MLVFPCFRSDFVYFHLVFIICLRKVLKDWIEEYLLEKKSIEANECKRPKLGVDKAMRHSIVQGGRMVQDLNQLQMGIWSKISRAHHNTQLMEEFGSYNAFGEALVHLKGRHTRQFQVWKLPTLAAPSCNPKAKFCPSNCLGHQRILSSWRSKGLKSI